MAFLFLEATLGGFPEGTPGGARCLWSRPTDTWRSLRRIFLKEI